MRIYGYLLALLVAWNWQINACCLTSGTRYLLPSGSAQPIAVAFSPNGSLLATANSSSNNVTLFTVTNGVLNSGTPYALPAGSVQPGQIAFSPDGSLLAVLNKSSGNIVLFQVSGGVLSGATSYTITGGALAQAFAFSPSGAYVATVNKNGATGSITVFQVSAGTLINPVSYNLGGLIPGWIAFSHDGSYLFASTARFTVGSGGALSGQVGVGLSSLVAQLVRPPVSFNPDGSNFITDNVIFTVTNGILSGGVIYNNFSPSALAYSPDGSCLAVLDSIAGLKTYNVNGRLLSSPASYSLPAGASGPAALAFSPNGSYLAVADQSSNDVTVFSVSCLSTTTPAPTCIGTCCPTQPGVNNALPSSAASPNSLAFSSNGYLATANTENSANGTVGVFSYNSGVLSGVTLYDNISTDIVPVIAVSPDNSLIATVNQNPLVATELTVYPFASNGVVGTGTNYPMPICVTNPSPAYCLAGNQLVFSPTGKYLLVPGGVNLSSGMITYPVNANGTLGTAVYSSDSGKSYGPAFAVTPNEAYLIAAGPAYSPTLQLKGTGITVLGFSTGAYGTLPVSYGILPTGSTSPKSVTVSPNGQYVVTGNYGSNDVTVFSFNAGAIGAGTSYPLPLGSQRPLNSAFSPDGNYLATVNETDDVTVFKVSNGALISSVSYSVPVGNTSPKTCTLAFSTDSAYLAVGQCGASEVTMVKLSCLSFGPIGTPTSTTATTTATTSTTTSGTTTSDSTRMSDRISGYTMPLVLMLMGLNALRQ